MRRRSLADRARVFARMKPSARCANRAKLRQNKEKSRRRVAPQDDRRSLQAVSALRHLDLPVSDRLRAKRQAFLTAASGA